MDSAPSFDLFDEFVKDGLGVFLRLQQLQSLDPQWMIISSSTNLDCLKETMLYSLLESKMQSGMRPDLIFNSFLDEYSIDVLNNSTKSAEKCSFSIRLHSLSTFEYRFCRFSCICRVNNSSDESDPVVDLFLMPQIGYPGSGVSSRRSSHSSPIDGEKIKIAEHLSSCLHEALILVDEKGFVRFWNSSAESIFGWSSSFAIGQKFKILTHFALSASRDLKHFQKALQKGQQWSEVLVARTSTGEKIIVKSKQTPIYNTDGNLQGIIIAGMKESDNITISNEKIEQEQSNLSAALNSVIQDNYHSEVFWRDRMKGRNELIKKLKKENVILSAVATNVDASIVVVDRSKTILFCSKAFINMFGVVNTLKDYTLYNLLRDESNGTKKEIKILENAMNSLLPKTLQLEMMVSQQPLLLEVEIVPILMDVNKRRYNHILKFKELGDLECNYIDSFRVSVAEDFKKVAASESMRAYHGIVQSCHKLLDRSKDLDSYVLKILNSVSGLATFTESSQSRRNFEYEDFYSLRSILLGVVERAKFNFNKKLQIMLDWSITISKEIKHIPKILPSILDNIIEKVVSMNQAQSSMIIQVSKYAKQWTMHPENWNLPSPPVIVSITLRWDKENQVDIRRLLNPLIVYDAFVWSEDCEAQILLSCVECNGSDEISSNPIRSLPRMNAIKWLILKDILSAQKLATILNTLGISQGSVEDEIDEGSDFLFQHNPHIIFYMLQSEKKWSECLDALYCVHRSYDNREDQTPILCIISDTSISPIIRSRLTKLGVDIFFDDELSLINLHSLFKSDILECMMRRKKIHHLELTRTASTTSTSLTDTPFICIGVRSQILSKAIEKFSVKFGVESIPQSNAHTILHNVSKLHKNFRCMIADLPMLHELMSILHSFQASMKRQVASARAIEVKIEHAGDIESLFECPEPFGRAHFMIHLSEGNQTNVKIPIYVLTGSKTFEKVDFGRLINVLKVDESVSKITSSQDINPKPISSLHVLTIDDNSESKHVLDHELTWCNIWHDSASSGIDAFHMIEERPYPYDLILMDLQKLEMNGVDMTERIRKLGRGRTPVIAAIAAIEDLNSMSQYCAAGMDWTFIKPLSRRILKHFFLNYFEPLRNERLKKGENPNIFSSQSIQAQQESKQV